MGLRVTTLIGFLSSAISLLITLVYLIMKLCNWQNFQAGYAPMILGIFILGSLQFFYRFAGRIYLNINTCVIHRPLVVEEKRINFEKKDTE